MHVTTIAYKDGIIAYDSRCCRTGYVETDKMDKCREYKGYRFFLSGSLNAFEELTQALVDGEEFEDLDAGGLMIDPAGVLWFVGGCEQPWKSRHDCTLPTASGSGTQWALAAMDFGRTAKQAVKYAMSRDPGTGGKVRTFKVALQ
jgi:hypothetical protein